MSSLTALTVITMLAAGENTVEMNNPSVECVRLVIQTKVPEQPSDRFVQLAAALRQPKHLLLSDSHGAEYMKAYACVTETLPPYMRQQSCALQLHVDTDPRDPGWDNDLTIIVFADLNGLELAEQQPRWLRFAAGLEILFDPRQLAILQLAHEGHLLITDSCGVESSARLAIVLHTSEEMPGARAATVSEPEENPEAKELFTLSRRVQLKQPRADGARDSYDVAQYSDEAGRPTSVVSISGGANAGAEVARHARRLLELLAQNQRLVFEHQ